MHFIRTAWLRMKYLIRGGQLDRDLDDELSFHLDSKVQASVEAGAAPEQARSAARRQFGNVTSLKETSRDMFGIQSIETLFQDLRYGFRVFRKDAAFTTVAVLALALGIGANSTIFSIVNTVLLRPLPYRDVDRLVMIFERLEKAAPGPVEFSPPDFVVFEREQKAFSEVAAYANTAYDLSSGANPERIVGARVSPSLFSALGVEPSAGRMFTPDEDRPGGNVVVLSHHLWQNKFGADPGVLGKAIHLDRRPYTVIGIMPKSFEFPHRGPIRNNTPADLWVPLAFTREELGAWTSRYNHSVVARLKPGVTLAQARAEATAIARRLQREFYPTEFRGGDSFVLNASLEPFQTEITGRVRDLLIILQGAVILVLLITCTNVANLLLTRAAGRHREMAIRTALGAGRLRLIQQLLVENLPLALTGGALGLVLAYGAIRILVLSPLRIPRLADIHVDGAVLVFTLLVCAATTLLFGLVPALQLSRSWRLGDGLKESSRNATPSLARHRLLAGLVIAQFALGLVLLAGAGLLLRSFARLLATNPGFRPEGVLSLSLNVPASAYQDARTIRSFWRLLLDRVQTLPGVKAVAVATDLPLAVRERRGFSIQNLSPAAAQLPRVAAGVWVMGSYFEALGIRLTRGRFLTPQDGLTGEPVIVINDTLARRYFPGEDPVGRHLRWGRNPWMTIVGVVEDVKHGPLRADVIPQVFEPYLQVPDDLIRDSTVGMFRSLRVMLRTAGTEPTMLASAIRNEVRKIDPELPIVSLQTLDEYVSNSVNTERFNAVVFGTFAMLAVFLAAIGIYGVLSYSVSQRIHEIGIRVALGARNADVLRLVVGRGIRLAGAGIALGVLASLFVTKVLQTLLYGVTARDPGTFVAVALVLGAVALLACYVPARRAARIDPIVALRYE